METKPLRFSWEERVSDDSDEVQLGEWKSDLLWIDVAPEWNAFDFLDTLPIPIIGRVSLSSV